jgi:hypothetical protein
MWLLVISTPFLHAFGFFGASLPLVIGALALAYLFCANRFRLTLHFSGKDWFLIAPLIIGMVVLDYSSIQSKHFSHTMLWIVTVTIFYFGTKVIVVNSKFSLDDLGREFLLALFVASLGVTLDFMAINFYGFYLSDVIPYQIGEMDVTKNFGNSLFRVRGFAAEPGFTAMVYELLLPLGLFYCVNHRQYLILIPFILVSYLILTSAASLLGLFVCLSLFSLATMRKIVVAVVLISVIGFLFSEEIYFYFDQAIGPKMLIVLTGDSIRVQLLESLLPVLLDNPTGIGFGALSHAFETNGYFGQHRLIGGGTLNLYLEIALISGVVGLVSFLTFLVSVFYRSMKLGNRTELVALRFSLLWLCIHHAFLTEYYFPMLWVNLALIATFNYIESRSVNPQGSRFIEKNKRPR